MVVSRSPNTHATYLATLLQEIRAVSHIYRGGSPSLRSLYLGGGTPSLLDVAGVASVIRAVEDAFGMEEGCEVTCEMDPGTFGVEKATGFRESGVNRVSMGVQSFDEGALKVCGRGHGVGDVWKAVDALGAAGLRNFGVDLITGLPGVPVGTFRDGVERAVASGAQHVSCYDLEVEKGTRFGKDYRAGVAPLPEESAAAEMIGVAADVLAERGFERYEVSNYAQRSEGSGVSPVRSRHNMAYWKNEPFYAFGLGATSVVDGFRFARPRVMSAYRRYVEELDAAVRQRGLRPPNEFTDVLYPNCRRMSARERLEDFYINRFRLLVEGVDMKTMCREHGEQNAERLLDALARCEHLLNDGFLAVDSELDGRPAQVRLTEKGALVENSVLSTLLQEAMWKFPEDIHEAHEKAHLSLDA